MHLIICIIRPYRAPDPVAIARHNEHARRPPYKPAPFCRHPAAFTKSFAQ